MVVLCGALLLGAASAYAEGSADENATNDPCLTDPKCQEFVVRAREASQAQRFEDAQRAYIAAYAVKPMPWLLLNIGRVQHKLGRYDDAIQMYRAFLDLPQNEGNDEQRKKATEYLHKAESELATQRLAVKTGLCPTQPAYKKWWFWTLIGGAAVAVVATGLGVGLTNRPPSPSLPMGVTIYYRSF